MSAACGARSTTAKPIRSSIPCAAWDFASVLLAKTLRSSTLRLALLAIAVFGAAVVALFGYVYWSTASFVRTRADRAIDAEQVILLQAYQRGGRNGLIVAINEQIAQNGRAGGCQRMGRIHGSDAPWRQAGTRDVHDIARRLAAAGRPGDRRPRHVRPPDRDRHPARPHVQIGRASCRERV